MSIKILWCDTETSGLTPANGLIQIGAIIEIDGQTIETINYRMNVCAGDLIVDQALQCNGITRSQLRTFPHPSVKYHRFVNTLKEYVDHTDPNDTFILAGYNVNFDMRMLKAWFIKHDPEFCIHNLIDESTYDVLSATRLWFKQQGIKVGKGNAVENHKLTTIAKYFGIEEDFHDALGDIRATKKIYEIVTGG